MMTTIVLCFQRFQVDFSLMDEVIIHFALKLYNLWGLTRAYAPRAPVEYSREMSIVTNSAVSSPVIGRALSFNKVHFSSSAATFTVL